MLISINVQTFIHHRCAQCLLSAGLYSLGEVNHRHMVWEILSMSQTVEKSFICEYMVMRRKNKVPIPPDKTWGHTLSYIAFGPQNVAADSLSA